MKTFIVFFILFACVILFAASEAYARGGGHANARGVYPPSPGIRYGKSGPQHFFFGSTFVFHVGHKKL